MQDASPTDFAAIARRMLQEIPGFSSVPHTPGDAMKLPESFAPSLPSSGAPAVPPAPQAAAQTLPPASGASQFGSVASSGFGHGEPAFLGLPGAISPSQDPIVSSRQVNPKLPISLPAIEPSTFAFADGFGKSPFAAPAVEEAFPSSPAAPSQDGLRNFVSQVRHGAIQPPVYTQPSAGDRSSLVPPYWHPKGAPSGPRPFDVAAIRRDFPVLQQQIHGKPLVWFDNAATTQKPQSVIDAVAHYYERDNSNIHRAAHSLAARSTDAYEQARRKVQLFLGAGSPEEIIWVRGTTEGINLIAQTYGRKFLQPGDEIVMSTLEHHANIVPWQLIAKEKGAVIRVIPVNDRGEIMLEEYGKLLGPRTKLVSLTHASNSLGTILPIGEMTQMAKRYGARVLIDGAQSVAHIPVNLQELGADFFVFSGHKIFGPTGIGVVYAKEELQEIMPPWQGGGNMIKNVTFEETTFQGPPAKFEAGTPSIADAIGLGAALDYVTRLGLPNIAKYEHELLHYATEQLARIGGLRQIGTARNKVGVLSFDLKGHKSETVGKMLDQEGIAVRAGHHCAQPSLRRFGVETTVRPSLSIYNTCEEVDRLITALRRFTRQ